MMMVVMMIHKKDMAAAAGGGAGKTDVTRHIRRRENPEVLTHHGILP